MFAGQTATYQVDGEMENREKTPQDPSNDEFFPAIIQPHGPYNGATTMVFHPIRPIPPFLLRAFCIAPPSSHPEMKFLDNATQLYT